MTTIRLGITGGIGSGKSYVCHLLRHNFSIPVYNCDVSARHLMQASPQVRKSLSELLGSEVYHPDGTLNRPLVSSYLFASAEHALQVQSIVHPAVRAHLRQWFAAQSAPIAAMESAILYESDFACEVDHVILVQAPLEVRISRTILRDNSTRETVLQRMTLQDEQLAHHSAHFRVLNDGITPVLPQLTTILQTLNSTIT